MKATTPAWIFVFPLLLALSLPAMAGQDKTAAGEAGGDMPERPVMDVVFCLDSTGSMGGEIRAAKEKIWSIANKLLEGTPRPVVRFGVVTYRDKGDAYIVKKIDLTDDIDLVHEFLMGISAAGGGDGPENVRAALRASVEQMNWTDNKEAIKSIFLVGDAEPHQDYTELPSCADMASKAVAKGININTIACGSLSGTGEKIWKQIAELSDGEFQRISRSAPAFTRCKPGAPVPARFREKIMMKRECGICPGDCDTYAKPCAAVRSLRPESLSSKKGEDKSFERAIINTLKRKARKKGIKYK